MTAAENRAVRTMYLGLALTVLAAVLPLVDAATTGALAAHVRAGYPAYDRTEVTTAVTAWAALLGTVGVLGVVAWLVTIRAVRAGRRWAASAGVAALVLGVAVALAVLTVQDTSGDVGLAPALGAAWALPCAAGAAALVMLRRDRVAAP